MLTKRCLTLAIVILSCTSMTASTALAAEANEQKQAIGEIRNTGTALFAWLLDQGIPESTEKGKGDGKTIDLSSIPEISHAELAKLLVPLYMAELPVNDPWGHPYEYRLHRANLGSVPVMAIRSAGKDGKLSGPVYEVKSFPIDHLDQDLVWVDGYFARWPEDGAKE